MASPFERIFTARVAGTAAATATRDDPVVVVPYAGNVTSVTVVTQATYTGQATDYKDLKVINKGLTGGDTRVAATKTFSTAGDVATAFDETTITVTSTAASVAVVAGDVLALSQVKVGNGLTVPDMLVKIGITASN